MQQLAFNFEQLEQPMTGDYLINRVQVALDTRINLRKFHNIIRKLRKSHGLPILSRRTKPMGYWWCASVAEMNEFIENFRSQAMDELHTLSRIVNKNYPLLAGQLNFRDAQIQEEADARLIS